MYDWKWRRQTLLKNLEEREVYESPPTQLGGNEKIL